MSDSAVALTAKAALLNEEEDALSDQFEAVLEDVFRRFAVKTAGGDVTATTNVDELSMAKKELDTFSEATNGSGKLPRSSPLPEPRIGWEGPAAKGGPRLTGTVVWAAVCRNDAGDVR